MESAYLGAILGVVAVLGAFWGLTVLNDRQGKRILKDLCQPRKTRQFDLEGELLPREEVGLGPVDYRRLPAAEPVGYIQTTQQARHAPTVETSFVVPALTALGTALALTIAAGALAWAFGWPARTVLVIFALSLAGGWFWRLGFADKVLWQVESWTGKDFDGDGYAGAPMTTHLAAVQPETARQDVARQTRQTATNERLFWLQAFVHRCYLAGCSESAQGIKPGDRARYLEARDMLLRLGLAQWRDGANKRLGWVMVADEPTAIAIIANHVTEL